MTKRVKEKIIELRNSGKSYNEISRLLKCSTGTISYHCGIGQNEKTNKRNILSKNKLYNKLNKKIRDFSFKKEKSFIFSLNNKLNIKQRIKDFSMSNKKEYLRPLFTKDELLNKIGDNPKCYISGKLIDINNTKSWSLDHKIPRSRGGDNTLDNAGICDAKINSSKTDMMIEEFLEMCKLVLENNGYKVSKEDIS